MTQTPSSDASPLAEAQVGSLSELMARDPLGLSDADIGTIVAELRRKRELWVKAEADGTTRKRKATPASPTISLDDIGL